ncbi:MAG: hypothetical protein CO093_10745 [Alphaproteobacteria bacterium CG_4_9_14_3_um_filter_47_13]|nr:MAG: hypothetical protein CO093_10745 [Alphaproteobacteria bacterium CG_4_9_14_3_um_filter_47_13]
MKWFIRGAFVFGIIFILIIGVVVVILTTFDLNNYKDRITESVKESTGRELVISGDIETSFFPVLGFKVSGIQIGNPPGFSDQDFLIVDEAQAGVKIIPLLNQRIELTKIVLKQPGIHIIKKTNGETNLTFNAVKKPDVKTAGNMQIADLSIGSIEITNAKVIYEDQGSDKTFVIDPLNITLPEYSADTVTNIAFNMTLKASDSTLKINGMTKAEASPKEGALYLSNLKIETVATSGSLKESITVNLSGSGRMNIKTQDMNLNIPNMGISWPGTDIKGKANIEGKFSAPFGSFNASSSSVNLDSLLAGIRKEDKKNKDKPLLPVDMLRSLNLDGSLSIETLVLNELSINNVQAKINAKDGAINIAPLTADFYEGKANAVVSINTRSAAPVLTLKNEITGIEIGDVLKAKMGDNYITGKADISYDLSGVGNTVTALQNAANGTVSFNFSDGYINKWQLSSLMNQAIAFFESGAIEQNVSDKVYFTNLSGTFAGNEGVFLNDDLILTGPKMNALGSGEVNLAAQTVDYIIKIGLGTETKTSGKRLPIRMNGSLTNPSYSLDTQALIIDTAKDKLEKTLLKKLENKESTAPENKEAEPSSPDEAAKKLIEGFLGGQ